MNVFNRAAGLVNRLFSLEESESSRNPAQDGDNRSIGSNNTPTPGSGNECDVDEVRELFAHGFEGAVPILPVEVVDMILDAARMWVWEVHNYEDEDINEAYIGMNAQHILVSAQLKTFNSERNSRYRLREIQVSGYSHDQGWSSYPEDHRTTNNSWTWVEASVGKILVDEENTTSSNDTSSNDSIDSGSEKRTRSFRAATTGRIFHLDEVCDRKTKRLVLTGPLKQIHTNLHAVDTFQHFDETYYWYKNSNHNEEEGFVLLNQLQREEINETQAVQSEEGEMDQQQQQQNVQKQIPSSPSSPWFVFLWARSIYPGWSIYTKDFQIRIAYMKQ
eukprot:Nk52_evm28s307 gene=Nk52_evmTU28s307